MTPRLVSTTCQDGQYSVTVTGLESWPQADQIAQMITAQLRRPAMPSMLAIIGPVSEQAARAIEQQWEAKYSRP